MREIKFRAWDAIKQYMITSTMYTTRYVSFDGKSIISLQERMTCLGGGLTPYTEGLLTLMQYTGLKDKHGKEIYEGDLVRVPAKDKYEETTFNCFEVFYHDNECIGGQNIGFCINRMHPQGNSAGGYGFKFTPESMKDFEIIGNIYENPEVLNNV